MGVDAWGFPGGLLRLDPAFAYVEPPSSWPLSRAEYLTLAPNIEVFSSLILHDNNEPFLNCVIVTWDEKCILYNWWWVQWLDQEAKKHFPKPNLHPKKVMVTVFGLLPFWSTIAFWVLVKPLYLRTMLSRSMRCTENCNACSWHWSTEWAQFFSTETPDCRSYNQCFKNRTNWATKFCLICHYSPDLSPTNYHFFKHLNNSFSGKTLPAGGRKCFPRVHWILKHGFLCYRNKLISRWQKMCWL